MHRRLMLSIAMLAIGAGLLAATAPAGPSGASSPTASSGPAQKGGTFRYSLDTDIDYVDPALAYYNLSWQIEYATTAMLMTYPDAPAPRGSRLVPEVAAGFPKISSNGRTYTFTLKKTYKFSNGKTVTAANYAAAINRNLNPKMASPAQPFIEDIVGASAVIDGKATKASGVKVLSPYKLQITLTKRAPDLLSRLAMPFFAPIPTNMPINADGVGAPILGTGPYYISKWEPKRSITLLRNPHYKGPRPHNVNRIQYDIGLPLQTIRLNIESNATDFGPVPPAAHAELGQKYGVRKSSPGPVLRQPVGCLPLPGDEPRPAALRRLRSGERRAEEGRQQRDRPDRDDQPARCVRGRHQRPVHAAEHAWVQERGDLPGTAERRPRSLARTGQPARRQGRLLHLQHGAVHPDGSRSCRTT